MSSWFEEWYQSSDSIWQFLGGGRVSWFPMVTVLLSHKFSDCKQHEFIL
jgi:hypothetical protein